VSFLLDTNSVSEWVKPQPNPGLIGWMESVDEDRIFLTIVSLAELRYGVERMAAGRRRNRLDQWLGPELMLRFEGRILPVDANVAEALGQGGVAQRGCGTSSWRDGRLSGGNHRNPSADIGHWQRFRFHIG